jgi:hypothetical protein
MIQGSGPDESKGFTKLLAGGFTGGVGLPPPALSFPQEIAMLTARNKNNTFILEYILRILEPKKIFNSRLK